MPAPSIKQVCPSCNSAGLLQFKHTSNEHAVVCPQCEGRGWIRSRIIAFTSRARLPGVTQIRPTGMQSEHIPGLRGKNWLTYDEFEQIVPSILEQPPLEQCAPS